MELRTPNPLINLRVLRNGDVLVANSTAIGLGAAMYIGLSIGSLIAQAPDSTAYGIALPLFWAGFVMLPLSVASFGANRLVRALSHRIRMRTLLLLGVALVTASSVLLWFAHTALWEILIGMFGFGAGMGMTYAAMPALIARSVADTELGSALAGAVLAANLAPDLHPTEHGITLALAVGALGCVVVFAALLVNHLISRPPTPTSKPADPRGSRLYPLSGGGS